MDFNFAKAVSFFSNSRYVKLQRSYMWEFLLTKRINGIEGTDLSKFCLGARFGDYSISDVVEQRHGAYKIGFAGDMSIPDLVVTYYKINPDIVAEYFRGWKGLIVDEKGFYSPRANYVASAYTILQDVTGRRTETYILRGVFPKVFPALDLSYESNSYVKYDIHFNVDTLESSNDSPKAGGLLGKAGTIVKKFL